jgi:hypothetical protein
VLRRSATTPDLVENLVSRADVLDLQLFDSGEATDLDGRRRSFVFVLVFVLVFVFVLILVTVQTELIIFVVETVFASTAQGLGHEALVGFGEMLRTRTRSIEIAAARTAELLDGLDFVAARADEVSLGRLKFSALATERLLLRLSNCPRIAAAVEAVVASSWSEIAEAST